MTAVETIMQAEITRLRAELAQAMQERSRAIAVGSDMEQEVERLRDQLHLAEVARVAQVEGLTAGLDALRVDAERYRYLRDISRRDCLLLRGPEAGVWCECEDENGELYLLTEGDLDAAIDAARKGAA